MSLDIRIGRLRHLLVAPGLLEVALVGSLDSFEVLGATRIFLNGAVSDAPTVLRWLYFHRGPVHVELFSSTTGYGALTEASFSEITDISPDEGDEMAQKQTQSTQATQQAQCPPDLVACLCDPDCRKLIDAELPKECQARGLAPPAQGQGQGQGQGVGSSFSAVLDLIVQYLPILIDLVNRWKQQQGGGAQAAKPTP